MADKDLTPMFNKIGPLINKWYFTDLPTARAASAQDLRAMWLVQPKQVSEDVQCFTDPMAALQAAIDAADPADRIVVFGSFYTVGGVLQNGTPRLQAKHLSA